MMFTYKGLMKKVAFTDKCFKVFFCVLLKLIRTIRQIVVVTFDKHFVVSYYNEKFLGRMMHLTIL